MERKDLIRDIIDILSKDLSSNIKVKDNQIIVLENGYCILPAIIHDNYVMLYDEGFTGGAPIYTVTVTLVCIRYLNNKLDRLEMKSMIETQRTRDGYQSIVKADNAENILKLPDWQFVDELEQKIYNSLKLGLAINYFTHNKFEKARLFECIKHCFFGNQGNNNLI